MEERSLAEFVEQVCGEGRLRVEDDFGGGFVRLRSSEAERRQAKHDIRCSEDVVIELLRNARDAHARSIFLACSREGNARRFCIIDDGEGIPEHMHRLVFEPRVTSKLDTVHTDRWGVHGRGMALFSIASNAKSACVVASEAGKGCSIAVETDLAALPEKTDQSTAPTFSYDAEGKREARGPRNIMRMVYEFADEHKSELSVYFGSPTEIAATLYAYGVATVPRSVRAFCENEHELTVPKRLALASDPADFAERARALGLDMSDRSARRILDGAIRPLDSVAEIIEAQSGSAVDAQPAARPRSRSSLLRDARGLKIAQSDLNEFSENLADAWRDLAERYYLDAGVSPVIRVSHDGVHVFFPAEKQR